MFINKRYGPIRVIAIISFIIMVIINGLANALPLNGLTTGEVSSSYENLFQPAGYTFSIVGLIYLLLLFYSIHQLGIFRKGGRENTELLDEIGLIFTLFSVVNIIWIFAWHYGVIWLSLILMVIMLISLFFINRQIRKEQLTFREKVLIKLPFSIYFGWITIMTIANIITFLVSINWNGLGISSSIWTVVAISIGFLIATAVIRKNRDIPYGIAVIWAYIGILLRHSSDSGFGGKYPSVISAVSVCIAFLIIVEIYTLFKPEYREK